MTDPTPTDPSSAPARAARSAADQVFRTALRDMLVLLGALVVLGVGIGALVAGTKGVWGALIGVGLALVFSGTTVVSMLRTSGASPQKMAAVVMGAWLGKIIVVIVVLALITERDFYSKPVLAIVLLVGVLGSAYLDYRAVTRGRIPYVEPGASSRPTGRDGAAA
ncbi:hypothetical protein [uncultured Cellulomonas sp.]|uniref:hypothetical protein n=1 Tax=uncultured Cellulomonas sp. TaxID=189682 RepID=UPI0028E3E461|nr:hypothetical protein [uncultured Cellulomonas sp.]